MLPSNSPRRTFAASLAATALVCAPLLYSPFAAAILKYDPVKSTVSATFKQVGVPIEAKFKRIVAHIDYDSAKPDAAHANVEIDVNSFDLGDPEYNKEVMKKEWFNGAQFPKATFVSSSIKAGSNGQLDVSGKLSIKGKTVDVRFPLTVKKEANLQIFDGSLPIKRLLYNIGEGDWKDTSTVADEVVIKFHIITAQ